MPPSRSLMLTLLLFLAGPAVSQIPGGRIPFRLDADAARFSGSDSLTYVQIYYGIPEAGLTYVPGPGGGLRGAVEMRLRINDSSGTVASRDWVVPRSVRDTTELSAPRNILSFESLALPEGHYRVLIASRDSIDPSRADSVAWNLPVRGFTGPREALSDIELCSRITPGGDRSSPFYRNTLEVIPNPSRLYGEGLPVVHFYAEVYNLDAAPGPEALLRVSILDAGGREVAVQSKSKPRTHSSSVEYGSMNISSLPGGSYLFRITLFDSSATPPRALAVSEKKFFVYNPAGAAASPASPGGGSDRLFAFMTEAEADEEIRRVRYIATEYENRQIELLGDLMAKRNFLKNFWSGRSAGADDGGGTARAGYLARIQEANAKYTDQGREGWLTDRGRVSIVYGPPDNIERHPSTSESRPYEVWEYPALRGGVVFIFVDRLGFGSYRLVHSTHIDELRNENWYQDEAQIR